MRIVGKFRDYYDGINPSMEPFWKRIERSIDLDTTKKSELSFQQQNFCIKSFLQMPSPDIDYPQLRCHKNKILGLCGKMYPIYEIEYDGHIKTYLDAEKYVEDHNQLYTKPYTGMVYHAGRKLMYYNNTFLDILGTDQWQVEFQRKEYVNQLFIDLDTPVFIIHKEHCMDRRIILDVNPCLRDHEFQRLFDVYSLYQMIEQYLSNELVTKNDKPDIMTDNIKRDKHGFDGMSFKKHGKKKRGKKK